MRFGPPCLSDTSAAARRPASNNTAVPSRTGGINERCDVEPLALTAQAYRRIAQDFPG
jgi:hypothetical protein